jgi:hypothetical protein
MAIQQMAKETHISKTTGNLNNLVLKHLHLLHCIMATSFYPQITYCHHHDVGQLWSTRLCYQIKCTGWLTTKNMQSHQNQPTWKLNCPHQHQSSWMGYKIYTIQTNFLKLFLASNSSYLMYLFRQSLGTEHSSGLSFTASLCNSSKCLFVRCIQKSEFEVRKMDWGDNLQCTKVKDCLYINYLYRPAILRNLNLETQTFYVQECRKNILPTQFQKIPLYIMIIIKTP